jgi:hypothetical protein
MALVMLYHILDLWVACGYQHLRGAYCLHLLGSRAKDSVTLHSHIVRKVVMQRRGPRSWSGLVGNVRNSHFQGHRKELLLGPEMEATCSEMSVCT